MKPLTLPELLAAMPRYHYAQRGWMRAAPIVELLQLTDTGDVQLRLSGVDGLVVVSGDWVRDHAPRPNTLLIADESAPMLRCVGILTLAALTPEAEYNKSRVSQEQVESTIASEHFFTAGQGAAMAGAAHSYPRELDHVTVCVLTLHNGHKVVGVNEGPVDPKNFDPNMGRDLARKKAVEQIWPLLGYELRNKLAAEGAGA